MLIIWSPQQIKIYQLASQQLQFVLIYYIRIITDISLIISEIIISLKILNRKKYIHFSKERPTFAEFFILKYAYITSACNWSRNIGWLLHNYSSVRVHFWSRNNIEAFPLAQHQNSVTNYNIFRKKPFRSVSNLSIIQLWLHDKMSY